MLIHVELVIGNCQSKVSKQVSKSLLSHLVLGDSSTKHGIEELWSPDSSGQV